MKACYLVLLSPVWWASTPARVASAAALTAAFAVVGRLVRGVTASGAIAGGMICFLLLVCAGPGGFVALFSLFVMTWIATRLGRQRKQRLGTAERREGRTAEQVLANLSIAAICVVLFATGGQFIWIIAMIAALAEAATDTVSSECGQAFSQTAWLVTSLESVPAGTDGGVSTIGTACGIAGGFVVVLACAVSGLLPMKLLWLPMTAGILGMVADSMLGAALERRGWLNNDQVNLAGTLIAAGVGVGLFKAFGSV
jgi:uncharacterized protein (TIGR00297 family)